MSQNTSLPIALGLGLFGALGGFALATFLAPGTSQAAAPLGELQKPDQSPIAAPPGAHGVRELELELEIMRLTAELASSPQGGRQTAEAEKLPQPDAE